LQSFALLNAANVRKIVEDRKKQIDKYSVRSARPRAFRVGQDPPVRGAQMG
jgi:hypothetical protein